VLEKYKPIIFCEVIPHKIEKELDAIFSNLDYSFYKAYENGLKKVSSFSESYDACIDYLIVPNEKIFMVEKFMQNS
jgi:hypothetical protein